MGSGISDCQYPLLDCVRISGIELRFTYFRTRHMSETRGTEGLQREVQRPMANSYVVPGTNLVAGEYPGLPPTEQKATLELRLGRFLARGITAFIDLTAPEEELAPYEPTLRALAELRGLNLEYERLPIPDMDVCDDQRMCEVLDAIDEHIAAKRTVYLHCWGGVGRTGTVVGCWLKRHGRMGEEALSEVARLFATMSPDKVTRHASWGSPQTEKQREMVREWPEGLMFRLSSAKTTEKRRRRKERRGAVVGAAPVTHVISTDVASITAAEIEDEEEEEEDDEDAADEEMLNESEEEERNADLEWRRDRAANARDLHTRIRGCLLGGALGDALGWPVEFLSLSAIRKQYGADGITDLLINANGVAEITDDTQMTLFTAEGVLRSTTRQMEHWADREPVGADWGGSHMPHSDVMRYAYLRWLATQEGKFQGAGGPAEQMPFGDPGWLVGVQRLYARRSPGNTCVSALRVMRGGNGERPANDSKGCGGVMRVAPIGLIPCEDPFAYAAMAARITHDHPSGYLAAGAYAGILSTLLFEGMGGRGGPTLREAVESVLDRLRKEPGHEETLAALEGALKMAARSGEPNAERVEALGVGWIAEEALAIGVYCAIAGVNFEHGVRLAVNHSGDSDSTGSIAGALLGVQCGEYGLPGEWLSRLELRDVISAIGDDMLVGYGGGDAWGARYPGV
jgi:ADP-ribosylglycohydrolase